jgi:hypothetical protein
MINHLKSALITFYNLSWCGCIKSNHSSVGLHIYPSGFIAWCYPIQPRSDLVIHHRFTRVGR